MDTTRCVNGHDLALVGGRDATGKCRECKREAQRTYDRRKAAEKRAAATKPTTTPEA
jgi:hypothetical protein